MFHFSIAADRQPQKTIQERIAEAKQRRLEKDKIVSKILAKPRKN